MKYWELISIMRSDRGPLKELLGQEQWGLYQGWYADDCRIVHSQNRDILDAIIPEDLAMAAMELCPERFQVEEGYLFHVSMGTGPSASISALDAYKQHGATTIEDALERGNAPIRVSSNHH